jgi:hypothetical protein
MACFALSSHALPSVGHLVAEVACPPNAVNNPLGSASYDSGGNRDHGFSARNKGMKPWLAAATAVGTATLAVTSALGRAPMVLAGVIVLVVLLLAVVVVPAVHSSKAWKRRAAQEVLRILLGRPRG